MCLVLIYLFIYPFLRANTVCSLFCSFRHCERQKKKEKGKRKKEKGKKEKQKFLVEVNPLGTVYLMF